MHAASGKRTRSVGLLGGDCGPDPAKGGRAASRSIFATCSLRRASCSFARFMSSWACASCSSERATEPSRVQLISKWGWSSLAFPFSVQCHPKATVDYRQIDQPPTPRAVLPKEWRYDGRICDHMVIASRNHCLATQRPCGRFPLRFHLVGRSTQFMRPRPDGVGARGGIVGRVQPWSEQPTFKKTGVRVVSLADPSTSGNDVRFILDALR